MPAFFGGNALVCVLQQIFVLFEGILCLVFCCVQEFWRTFSGLEFCIGKRARAWEEAEGGVEIYYRSPIYYLH